MVGDIVVQLPVRTPEEADRFGRYLTRFMDTRADDEAAPFMMVRTETMADGEWKVVTFQELPAAHAFSDGWRSVAAERDG